MRCVGLGLALMMEACVAGHEPPTRELKQCALRCYTQHGRLRADMKGCSACLPQSEEPEQQPEQELKQKTSDAWVRPHGPP